MPENSVLTTSRLTSPLIIFVISSIASLGLPPSFDIKDGFVVIPSSNPISLNFLIDSRFAVSRNIFIVFYSLTP